MKVLTTKRKSEIVDIELFIKYRLEYDIQHISSSIKFCYVALNEADVYIRNANIKLWDIVAGFIYQKCRTRCFKYKRRKYIIFSWRKVI